MIKSLIEALRYLEVRKMAILLEKERSFLLPWAYVSQRSFAKMDVPIGGGAPCQVQGLTYVTLLLEPFFTINPSRENECSRSFEVRISESVMEGKEFAGKNVCHSLFYDLIDIWNEIFVLLRLSSALSPSLLRELQSDSATASEWVHGFKVGFSSRPDDLSARKRPMARSAACPASYALRLSGFLSSVSR